MKTIYLDNAATTQIDEEVIEEIHSSMRGNFGNPSSFINLEEKQNQQ